MCDNTSVKKRCFYWAIELPVVALAAFSIVLTGCAEHRIGLDAFMEMQKQASLAASTNQPAASERQSTGEIDQLLGPYRVGASDVLGISVLGGNGVALFPPLQARVNHQGLIDLPLVSALKANGLDLEDLEQTIHDAYVPQYATEAVVHVDLISPHTTQVLVIGAVAAPGLVSLQRHQRNLLYAIVAAGGVSETASGRAGLRRIRDPDDQASYALTDPYELSEALALKPLEEGDIVLVEAAEPSYIYVGGLVNRPAVQAIPPGTSRNILQALAAAGGVRTDVTPLDGTLIRAMPDGKDVQVKLPLNRIARGEAPNLELLAGDILWIPETIGTKAQDFVNRNVFLRAGASVTYNVSGVEYLNRRSQQNGIRQGLESQFDPLGFLSRNTALQAVQDQTRP